MEIRGSNGDSRHQRVLLSLNLDEGEGLFWFTVVLSSTVDWWWTDMASISPEVVGSGSNVASVLGWGVKYSHCCCCFGLPRFDSPRRRQYAKYKTYTASTFPPVAVKG